MRNAINKLIHDDIGFEDLTTQALIPPDLCINGRIKANQQGVLAGLEIAINTFNEFNIDNATSKKDGEQIETGDIVIEIKGQARTILAVERTVLNLLMRLSGIATITNELLAKIRKVNPNIILAGTRKTTPGLQFFEKQAIRAGGGDPHRYRLDDSVLIKDNHLAIVGDISKAVKMARDYASFTTKIEVEADTKSQALEAAHAGADIIMLDNMVPSDVEDVLSDLKNLNTDNKFLVEVSGGINPENILDYVLPGVDVISSGYITHSASSLDMSLELDKL